MNSSLLIGKNGSGKSTIATVLEVFQSIGRTINRVGQLVRPYDFTQGRSGVPIHFEVEVLLKNKLYKYVLAFDLPENFKELRVLEERLSVENKLIYSRKEAQVIFYKNDQNNEANFFVDWHLVALPIIQEQSETDPLRIFKNWLAQMVILSPIPSLMTGESNGDSLQPEKSGSNFGEWYSGLLSLYPAAYTQIDRYLRGVIPDIRDFLNNATGKDSKNMVVRFKSNDSELGIDFDRLSDGEKCFFLCAIVVAANEAYGPLLCFWDEPDNYLSLSEVGHFIVELRQTFENSGQILVTSHNAEAIRRFSDENTFVLQRKNHLEPSVIRPLNECNIEGSLINALICDDIEQ